LRENLTAQEMSDASAAAARATQPDDMLLIFYSGHGARRATRRELGLFGVDVQLNRIENRGHDRPARRPRRKSCPSAASPTGSNRDLGCPTYAAYNLAYLSEPR